MRYKVYRFHKGLLCIERIISTISAVCLLGVIGHSDFVDDVGIVDVLSPRLYMIIYVSCIVILIVMAIISRISEKEVKFYEKHKRG